MKRPKTVPILSIISRITWILVWLITTYLIIYFSWELEGIYNLIIGSCITGFVFLFDYNIYSRKLELKSEDRYSTYLGFRVITSIIFMWTGSFAFISKIFEEIFSELKYQPSESNLDVFTKILTKDNVVSISFILIAIALFILDTLPFLFNTIKEKNDALIQKKIELNEAYEQQLKIIKIIEHDLGRKLAYASMNLENFMNQIYKIKNLDLNQKIPKMDEDDDEEEVDTFNDYLQRVENNLKYAISVVLNIPILVKADPSSWKPTDVKLKSYISSTIEKEVKNYERIQYQIKGTDPTIQIDKSQFEMLLHNVIKNAVMHGKKENNEELLMDFEIKEIIKPDLNSRTIVGYTKLIIRNNGNPLPEGFTIEKFKEPSVILGPTGHTGLGGHLISIIAQNHEALLEIHDAAPPFSVELCLKFKTKSYASPL